MSRNKLWRLLALLFALSLVHVFLEFPLNFRSFIGIGQEIKGRLIPPAD